MMIYPWQQTQWQQVTSYIQDKRLPHALLLTGPKDMGKLLFAQALTKQLFCQNPQPSACDTCRSCLWLAQGAHPDLCHIQPETAVGAIKIEQIRTLVDELNQTGQQGGYQLVIIEPAEAMNRAAANALLKTLEEPAGNVVFLLVSHQIGLLPATIVSRCQQLHFSPPPTAVGLSWLQQQLPTAPPADLVALLRLTQNMPLSALTLYNDGQQTIYHKLAEAFIQLHLGKLSPTGMATQCAALEFNMVFNILWLTAMDLLQLKLHGEQPKLMPSALLSRASGCTTCLKLLQFIDQLLLAKKQMIAHKINLNVQLLYEGLFVCCVEKL